MDKTYISFVVDHNPKFYYQAELLLWSLIHNANIPKSNIVVQCTNEVYSSFIDFLIQNSFTVCFIEKFLDGMFCNKLQCSLMKLYKSLRKLARGINGFFGDIMAQNSNLFIENVLT